jgi:hypothetical protein
MSLQHICVNGKVDVDLDVKSLKIQGQPVSLVSLSLDQLTYPDLQLEQVSTVFLASGPSTVISGISGCYDGQLVHFLTCQQASSMSFTNGGSIRTPGATTIVLSGVGESAVGIWSSALGYMTISKTS